MKTSSPIFSAREAAKPRSPHGRDGSPSRPKFEVHHAVFLALAFLFLSFASTAWGQETIASDGLNNTSTLFTFSGGAYYNGTTAVSDSPASAPFAVEGSHSRGAAGGNVTLTSVDINTSGYSSVQMQFRLASYSINATGNGADGADVVSVEVSPDGGLTYYRTVSVVGNTNARWSWTTGTGSASTAYDGDTSPVDFSPAGGGARTNDGFSTVTVTSIPLTSNLRIRITLLNNSVNELWLVDDFKITGTPTSATAPTITSFSPASGPVGAAVTINGTNFASNATVSFNGTASTNPTFTNNTSLTATVPSGATSGPIRVTVGSESGTSSSNFTVTVPGVPSVNSTTINGAVGQALAATVNATDSPSSFANSTALPAGLTLNSTTGAITGTPTSAGNTTVTVTATNGNGTGTGTLSFVIARGSQTISGVEATASRQIGDPSYPLNATTNSGLAISYTSSNTTVASIAANGTVTIAGIGSTTLTASQAGNTDWNPAANATQILTVTGPAINLSGSSLVLFSTTNGTASASQSFTVNGTNLTADILAAAPDGFEVSITSATSGFGPNAPLVQTGGNAAGTVFVRLAASAPVGTPSGNVTLTSPGATTRTLSVSGIVEAASVGIINVSPGALADFSAPASIASANQTLSVNATNLSGNLSIIAPAGYEVSLDGLNYFPSLSIQPDVPRAPHATDNASQTAYSGGWSNGTNGGSGFGPWIIRNSGNATTTIADPSAAGITGMPAASFRYGGTTSYTDADRTFSAPMAIGDRFSFQWGNNWDTNGSGSKGVNLYSGGFAGTQLVNINMGGSAAITINGTQMFASYGTNAITLNFEYVAANTLRVFATGRNQTESFDQTFAVAGPPDAFRLYAGDIAGDSENRFPYANNFSITAAGGNLSNTTLRVRLSANGTVGPVSGNLVLSSPNAATKNVALSGMVRPAVIPHPHTAEFPDPWFTFDAAGSANWVLSNGTMEINGAGSNVPADDWLIIGPFDFSTVSTPAIRFTTLAANTANQTNLGELSLKVSTNFSGTGSPSAASWSTVPFEKPSEENITVNSGLVPLPAAANTAGVYIAFHYTANGVSAGAAALWRVDDVAIGGSLTPPPNISVSGNLTSFSATQGVFSAAQSIGVSGSALMDIITVTVPAGFEVSTDGTTYSSTVVFPQTSGSATGNLSVRISSSASSGTISGNITLASSGANPRKIPVSGTVTIPVPGAPVVTPSNFTGTVGTAFSANITASLAPTSYGNATALPAGLSLNATTGVISGTPAAAGNSSVVISATNGNGTGSATFTFQIERGTPGVTTPPVATAIRVGQTLSNSTLSGGVATVPGTFAFTTPSTAPVATGNQSITFTPTDSANWNTATTNVSVTVNPAPTINVTPLSLTGFSTKQNAASANQTLTVNGTNLEGPITINASSGYEISTNGVSYSGAVNVSPSQAAPVVRTAGIIASDTASNYGIPGNHTWGNGTNGGTGFQPWLFNVVTNDAGTPPPPFYAGAFVGDPVTAQLTNFPSPAFGLYANPGGTAASATVSRAFSQPLAVGDSFSFQWATNWDSDVGNKGFNIFAGGNQVVNVNQGGFPGSITLNGQTAIDGAAGYGTQPMTWTFTRTTATNLLVTTTDRKGGTTVAFSTNVTISAGPDGFSFYTSAMGQGDQRQPYFNNLRITSSGSFSGGNLTDTTLFVRLAANGAPGAANGNLTFTSTNATTRSVSLSGTVIALAPPVITSRTISGTVGSNLIDSIDATNSPTSHTATGTLPPGVTFNATTGNFSGTPATAGNYSVAVSATNIDGTGLGNLTFAIGKGTPVITTAPAASLIYAGQALSSSTLSGGIANIPGNFTFTSPSLVPSVGNASQSVTFTPADSANWNTITTNVNVQVSPEPPAAPVVTDSTIIGNVGANLTASITASNGPISYGNSTALPPGLTLDPVTGAITGIPEIIGNSTTAVTATNIKGTGTSIITFVIGKGTPTVVNQPTARLYTDETLGAAYSPLPGQGLMNTAGIFTFVDPSLSFPNSANTTQTVSVLFTPFDQVNWNSTTINASVAVDPLPNYGNLTITAQVTELLEGDGFSESRIRIRRPGPLTATATIILSEVPAGQLSGDISGNLSFLSLPSQVTIPAGSNSTVFFVRAKDDSAYTGNRSVILSVTSRFHGQTAQSLGLNIIDDDNNFAAWSNNATRTPQRIRDYAIGGAAAPGLTGEAPLLTANSTHTGLSAIVRSVDPKLTVTGEYTTDLATGPWLSANLTLHSDQSGLSSAFQRRFFSIPIQPGETRKFLRLRIHLQE